MCDIFHNLPFELLIEILSHFFVKQDFFTARQINKKFNDAALKIIGDRYYFDMNKIIPADHIYQNVSKLKNITSRIHLDELKKYTHLRKAIFIYDFSYPFTESNEENDNVKNDHNEIFIIKANDLPTSLEMLILSPIAYTEYVNIEPHALSNTIRLNHLEIHSTLFEMINVPLTITYLKISIDRCHSCFITDLNILTPNLKELYIKDDESDNDISIMYDICLDKLNVTHLTITHDRTHNKNQKISFPKTVTHLAFYGVFHDNFIKMNELHEGLISLVLDGEIPSDPDENFDEYIYTFASFNRSIGANILPSTLEILIMNSFNHPLEPNILPSNLKVLKLNSFNQPLKVDILPKCLEVLELASFRYTINYDVLPISLRSLKLISIKSINKIKQLTDLTNLTELSLNEKAVPKNYDELLPPSVCLLQLISPCM